ncbi:MAG: heme-dependent oxidative N-demethylase subunit alpha family protein [Gammaproteobacteria bacterium]
MPKSLVNYKVAKYFPLANGQYEVKPGLFSLGEDFGNFNQDKLIFQLDQEYTHYRKNKMNGHNDQLSRYFCFNRFPEFHQRYITQHLIDTLCHEHPDIFNLSKNNNKLLLKNKLTKDKIILSTDYQLIESPENPYTNSIDAVMMQVQEDMAIISEDDHISCLHLMAPNFWSAVDKIGKSFSDIHKDVAGIDTIIKNSKAIIQAMIYKGPYVRFAWGLCSDSNLNHYNSQANPQTNLFPTESGRNFETQHPELFLRVERQTVTGLPEIKSALFTIRTYLYNIIDLNKNEIQCVINGINSMTDKQLEYKGLKTSKSSIIKWLSSRL